MNNNTLPDFGRLSQIAQDESDVINKFTSDFHKQMNEVVEENVKCSLINWSHAVLWKINMMESMFPSKKTSPQQIVKDVKHFLLMLTQIRDTKDYNDKILQFLGDITDDTRESRDIDTK
jgi:hypothetical protein